MNKGINEFVNYWEDIIKQIAKCELTEAESQGFLIDFQRAELGLEISRPYGWCTWEVENRLRQLRSDLDAALATAKSNYRRGYGKIEAETRKSKVKIIAILIEKVFKILSLPHV